MILAFAAMVATDFDTLDRAVESCRAVEATPAFAAEAERRNQFLTQVFKEQEAIIAERLDIATRRRALRDAGVTSIKDGDSEKALALRSAANDDRQKALNDNRMLEALRNDAMDAKRRYYLTHCASGKI